MKKVYCKNCKFENGNNRCIANANVSSYADNKEEGYTNVVRKEANFNGDCPHYERKWWKFWVK